MNASATLNVFRLFVNPALCLPHLQVPTFNELVFPLAGAGPTIKAIVLDKDNCFAQKRDDKVWHEYEKKWQAMKEAYPRASLLIVSNSAGTNDDPDHAQARALEQNTGIPVLRHSTKKPGCYSEILQYFCDRQVVTKPSEIAIVGDRLFTDVLMANMMGAYGVWVSKGVQESLSLVCKLERGVYRSLARRKFSPPLPK